MIASLAGIVAAWTLAWAGLRFPWQPIWWASLLVPLLWGLALGRKWPRLLHTGLYLATGLAGAAAAQGSLLLALGSLASALWAWDVGLVALALPHARLWPRAALRSGMLCAAGLGVGAAFAYLRLALPFWALVGGALAFWAALFLFTRGVRRLYGTGGATKGNRSSSRPMRNGQS